MLVVEDDVMDRRPIVLPLDSVAHLGSHRRRHKLQLIRLPDVDGSGHPAHFLGHGTAGWRGAAQERLVVRVGHGVHLQEHREVIQPAEFIALAEVLARLAGLDPPGILKAGLGVDLPSQARHPEGMEHVLAGDLQPHDLAGRDGQLGDAGLAVGVLERPRPLDASHLDGLLRRRSVSHVIHAQRCPDEDK